MNSKIKFSKFNIDLIISFFGQFFIMVIGMIINKILSNYLLISDYAIFNILRRLISLISFFLLSGMGISITRLISIEKTKHNRLMFSSIIISAFQVFLINIFIIIIIYYVFHDFIDTLILSQNLNNYIIYISFYLALLLSGSTLFIAILRGNDDYFLLNLYSITIQIFILLLLLLFPLNLEITILIHIMSYILVTLLFILKFLIKYFRKYRIKSLFIIRPKIYKSIYLYGFPRLPGEIILFGYPIVVLIIINSFYDLKSVAYFSNGFQIITLINATLGFVGIVLLPEVSKLLQLRQYEIINKTISRLGYLFIFMALCLSFFVFLFPEITTLVLYSRDFLDGIYVLRFIVFATVPFSIYLLLRNPIDAISVFPFNTINLIVSFIISLFIGLIIRTDFGFIISIFINYFLLGCLSFLTWSILLKKHKRMSKF